MNRNKIKHKILKNLVSKQTKKDGSRLGNTSEIESLCKGVDTSRDEIIPILYELAYKNEIWFDISERLDHISVEDKGFSSFYDGKYNKMYNSDIKDILSFTAQIIVPIIALIISIIAISNKNTSSTENSQQILLLQQDLQEVRRESKRNARPHSCKMELKDESLNDSLILD